MRSYSYSTSSMFCEVIMMFHGFPMGEYLIKGKGLYTALLIFERTLHGRSLFDNTGAIILNTLSRITTNTICALIIHGYAVPKIALCNIMMTSTSSELNSLSFS